MGVVWVKIVSMRVMRTEFLIGPSVVLVIPVIARPGSVPFWSTSNWLVEAITSLVVTLSELLLPFLEEVLTIHLFTCLILSSTT